MWALREKHTKSGQLLVPVVSCGTFASSTSIAGFRMSWFLLLLIVTVNQWLLLFGQTPLLARLHVSHDSWTFKDGAPADVTCLAQTGDGFLWLGGPNGLFRFDVMRSNLSGRRLVIGCSRLTCIPCLGRRLAALGGLRVRGLQFPEQWTGYKLWRRHRLGTREGVFGFAQDRDGIVWAATASGLWRFDHSGWQPIGVAWTLWLDPLRRVGFDRSCTFWWALALEFLCPQWISSTFLPVADTFKQDTEICQSRGSCGPRIEPS